MIGIYIVVIIGCIVIMGVLFINLSPQFGKGLTKKQLLEYTLLDNFQNGKFQNRHASPMEFDFRKLFHEWTKKSTHRHPAKDILVEKLEPSAIDKWSPDITRLIWFGHSTFLLQIDGKKILVDPMLSQHPSPIPLLGTSRFSKVLPISAEQLPYIDIVVLTHDHYDHLDYESIRILKDKVGQFITPLGVGNHLVAWGVDKSNITELNWWESIVAEKLTLTCTPARHFSGRGIWNRESTLWCSWVIEGQSDKLFFSGDSGYDTHFKQIGERFGPFDIALVECGQYNENWKYIHMMPEESAQAAVDLKSKLALPIHWGGFSLAFHDWTDPIERFLAKAKALNLNVTTPNIGQPVVIDHPPYPMEKWWMDYL